MIWRSGCSGAARLQKPIGLVHRHPRDQHRRLQRRCAHLAAANRGHRIRDAIEARDHDSRSPRRPHRRRRAQRHRVVAGNDAAQILRAPAASFPSSKMPPTATSSPTALRPSSAQELDPARHESPRVRTCAFVSDSTPEQLGVFPPLGQSLERIPPPRTRALVVVRDDLRLRDAVGRDLAIDQKARESPRVVARRTAEIEASVPALSSTIAAAFEAIAASIRLSCRYASSLCESTRTR